jgi:phosphoribosylformimino-5-aminoimidazole carboxamide ribonucleotide (ProFAR) isomerase
VELYPAIDVRGGHVARSPHGGDPLAVAHACAAAGARWVHFVDLDRAYDAGDNRDLARALLAAAPLKVQVGGGLATEAAIAEMLDWGAARVVIGPRAALDAALLDRLLRRHGAARLAVGIDARDGRVAPRGSGEVTEVTPENLARRAHDLGARTVVYADVRRDGALVGPDLAGARGLAALRLDVIVSGGIASLDDLRAARTAGVAGAIVGRALHEGRFTVAEAITCLA